MSLLCDKCVYRDLTPRPALELLKEAEAKRKAAYAKKYGMSMDEVEAGWNGRTQ